MLLAHSRRSSMNSVTWAIWYTGFFGCTLLGQAPTPICPFPGREWRGRWNLCGESQIELNWLAGWFEFCIKLEWSCALRALPQRHKCQHYSHHKDTCKNAPAREVLFSLLTKDCSIATFFKQLATTLLTTSSARSSAPAITVALEHWLSTCNWRGWLYASCYSSCVATSESKKPLTSKSKPQCQPLPRLQLQLLVLWWKNTWALAGVFW